MLQAGSNEEAVRKVRQEGPDVILLDILMPGTDGLETLKQIKAVHPEGQVIMLTALNTARTAFTAKETGAFDYVTKPLDVDELRLRVERAFERTRLSRELEQLREEDREHCRKIKVDVGNLQGRKHRGGKEKHRSHYRGEWNGKGADRPGPPF